MYASGIWRVWLEAPRRLYKTRQERQICPTESDLPCIYDICLTSSSAALLSAQRPEALALVAETTRLGV